MKSLIKLASLTISINILFSLGQVFAGCSATCSNKTCKCTVRGICGSSNEQGTLDRQIRNFEKNCGKSSDLKNKNSSGRSMGTKSLSKGIIKITP